MAYMTLFLTFLKIGLLTFGSGYAMLAIAQKEVVDAQGWITADEFADAVALSELTPGPIMVNMATFVGRKVGGVVGAIVATLGLVIPPMIVILVVSRLYLEHRGHTVVAKLLQGLRPAVIGLILFVVVRLARTGFKDYRSVLIGAGVLAAVLLGLHPVLAVLAAAAASLLVF